MDDIIYLDHAATTRPDTRVLEAMMPFLSAEYGNPSSVHRLGRKARLVVEESREFIAELIGAEPSEIVFTSGGTEANNLALRGASGHGRIITSSAEHEAVLRSAEAIEHMGRDVTLLDPENDGAVSLSKLREAMSEDVSFVSLMHANNEVGTMTDIESIAKFVGARDVLIHTDAVQTAGLLPIDVNELGVDLLSASAHKFYGPKGIGFLYVRGGVDPIAQITGGSQERRRRGGTENVASIVGMAEALRIARSEGHDRIEHAQSMRSLLIDALDSTLGDVVQINSPRESRRSIPGIVNISIPPENGRPLDGEMLLLNLDMEGVLVSAGSACTSGAIEPSHVLRAMGIPDDTARASVRFSMGKDTTEQEIERAVEVLGKVLRRMRKVAA